MGRSGAHKGGLCRDAGAAHMPFFGNGPSNDQPLLKQRLCHHAQWTVILQVQSLCLEDMSINICVASEHLCLPLLSFPLGGRLVRCIDVGCRKGGPCRRRRNQQSWIVSQCTCRSRALGNGMCTS